jgi:hypothetical protein
LAFVAVHVTYILYDAGLDGFHWSYEQAIRHPASGYTRNTVAQTILAVDFGVSHETIRGP